MHNEIQIWTSRGSSFLSAGKGGGGGKGDDAKESNGASLEEEFNLYADKHRG